MIAPTPILINDSRESIECNLSHLKQLQDALALDEETYCRGNSDDLRCKVFANTTNLALTAIARVMSTPGVQATVEWANCKLYTQKFLERVTLANTNYVAEGNLTKSTPDADLLTTRCWAEPGSLEYAGDPCCNVECVSLQFVSVTRLTAQPALDQLLRRTSADSRFVGAQRSDRTTVRRHRVHKQRTLSPRCL